MSGSNTTTTSTLVLAAKDESEGAFNSFKEKLEGVKGLLEKAFIWRAGEMAFDVARDGVSDFVNSLVGANAGVETLKTSLTALYGNAEQAGAAIEYMTSFSLAAPFAKDDILAAGQSIVSFHQNIEELLPAIGNVAAAMGVDLPSATQALEQAINTGRLTGLATTLHITKQELIDFGAETTKTGTIISSSILPAFEKLSAAQFSGGMSAQLNTFAGATTNLKNQFDNLAEIVGKPIFQALEGDLKSLVSFLSAHQADVNNFAANLGTFFGWAANTAGVAFTYIGNAIGQFVTWFQTTATPVIDTVVGYWAIGFEALSKAVSGGIGGVATLIGKALAGWINAFSAWLGPALDGFNKSWPATFNKILDAIGKDGPPLALAFAKWVAGVLPGIVKGFNDINIALLKFIAESTKDLVAKMKDLGIAIIKGLEDGIQSLAGDLKDKFVNIVETPYNAVRDFLQSRSPSKLYFDVGVDSIQGMINGIVSMVPALSAAMVSVGGAVNAGFAALSSSMAGPESVTQIGADIIAAWGGGSGNLAGGIGKGVGDSAPGLGFTPYVAPAVPKLTKLPSVSGLTGVGSSSSSGSSGGGSRVPLGALGANYGQVNASTGDAHQHKIASEAVKHTTLLETIASAAIRNMTPGQVPENKAKVLGVFRPVRAG